MTNSPVHETVLRLSVLLLLLQLWIVLLQLRLRLELLLAVTRRRIHVVCVDRSFVHTHVVRSGIVVGTGSIRTARVRTEGAVTHMCAAICSSIVLLRSRARVTMIQGRGGGSVLVVRVRCGLMRALHVLLLLILL
jgi:hypothetical protein